MGPFLTKTRSLFFSLIAFIVLLLLTIFLYSLVKSSMARLSQETMIEHDARIKDTIYTRLELYINALYGVNGFFSAYPDTNRKAFETFVDNERIFERYPGIFSTSFIQRVRDGDKNQFILEMKKNYPDYNVIFPAKRNEYYMVKYIQPFTGREKALGFDYLSEPIRKDLAEKARDTGLPQISEVLNSLNTKEKIFIVLLPIYRKNAIINNLEQRRQYLEGFAYSAISINNFFNNILKSLQMYSHVSWELYATLDGLPINNKNLIFQTNKSFKVFSQKKEMVSGTDFVLGGKIWNIITFHENGGLLKIDSQIPAFVLFTSGLVSIFVLILIYVFLNQRLMAEKLADKMTRAYKENEDKFQVISKATADAIIIINSKDDIIYWNKAAEKIFGYTSDEIFNKKLHEIIPFDVDMNNYGQDIKHFGETGDSFVLNKILQLEVKRKNGEKFSMEINISSIKINNDWHAVGILRDITERKKIEDEIKEHTQELERMNKLMIDRELKMVELKKQLKNPSSINQKDEKNIT